MELSDTQKHIQLAIRTLTSGGEPIATISDIAEYTDLSKQTVHNNIDSVLRKVEDIESRTIGQANVYYVKADRMEEIETNRTQDIIRLRNPRTTAEYVELRKTPSGSDFDLEAIWYYADGTEIEDYVPDIEEMGEAVSLYATDPISIKLHHKSDEWTEL